MTVLIEEWMTELVGFGPLDGAEAYQREAVARARRLAPATGRSMRVVQRVGIVGAGAMGRGIALAMLDAGMEVVVVDASVAALAAARSGIEASDARALRRGVLSAEQARERGGRLAFAENLRAIAQCDFVIEAVFEDLALKQGVMRSIDDVVGADVVLATNTSTLDIDGIASATRRPGYVIGTHFFMPAQVTRLLEVIPGRQTYPEVLEFAMRISDRLNKVAVVARNCDGFIGNRLFDRFHQEAMCMLEEGALPEQVDAALESFGMAIGPFRALDMIGNDIPWSVRQGRKRRNTQLVQPLVGDLLCEAGLVGQKTGRGWYAYADGERAPRPNPEANAIVEAASARLGLVRRPLAASEIVSRSIMALIDEAAAVLEDGVARCASDIDVVYVNGYGFPRNLGGPMYFADAFGLKRVVALVEAFAASVEARRNLWHVPALLRRSAEAGDSMTEGSGS